MESVQTVIRNFFPVFIARGVVQISAYVDTFLASFLPTGALSALVYAQTLYMLPVSLFGMSVSAAELPVFSSALGETGEVNSYLRNRLNAGLRQIAFFVIPSAMAFLLLGDVIAGAGLFSWHEPPAVIAPCSTMEKPIDAPPILVYNSFSQWWVTQR